MVKGYPPPNLGLSSKTYALLPSKKYPYLNYQDVQASSETLTPIFSKYLFEIVIAESVSPGPHCNFFFTKGKPLPLNFHQNHLIHRFHTLHP